MLKNTSNSQNSLHFKIIVPMYNVAEWIEKNIRSLYTQKYLHYQCVFIDDCSTDRTVKIVEKLISTMPNMSLIKNKHKQYALKNIIDGIHSINPNDDDVIIPIDGDDWLAHDGVLARVAREYYSRSCYLTFGNFKEFPSNQYSWMTDIPQLIKSLRLFRNYNWNLSHLRSFKYKLWKKIKKEDFLDKNGHYFETAWDMAIMFPMAEMANGQLSFISDILYIYNRATPFNDDKIRLEEQLDAAQYIRKLPPYSPLIKNTSFKQRIEHPKTMKTLFPKLMNSNNQHDCAKAYHHVAVLLIANQQYKLAIRYCNKANQLFSNSNHFKSISVAYFKMGENEKALHYMNKSNRH